MMKILIYSAVVDETGYKICKYSVPYSNNTTKQLSYFFVDPFILRGWINLSLVYDIYSVVDYSLSEGIE